MFHVLVKKKFKKTFTFLYEINEICHNSQPIYICALCTEDINIFYLCKHVTPISVNIMLFKHANSSNINFSYTKKHKIHKQGPKIIANGNNKNRKNGMCHPDYWHLEDKAIFKTLFFLSEN